VAELIEYLKTPIMQVIMSTDACVQIKTTLDTFGIQAYSSQYELYKYNVTGNGKFYLRVLYDHFRLRLLNLYTAAVLAGNGC